MSPLRVLSLFAGIGGIDLGLERAGMRVVAHSEVDPYASRVLAKHWPDVPNLGDITTIDWSECPPVDVIAGGFPCQDISLAGKGAGIEEGTRSGLWSYYADAVRELRPRYVIVENVAALAARGLDRVLGDLAALGYDAWWDCVPAAAVGAPHRRDRLFIVSTRADVAPFDTDRSPMRWASYDGADAERKRGERRRGARDMARASGARESEGHQRERDGDAAVDLRPACADERGQAPADERGQAPADADRDAARVESEPATGSIGEAIAERNRRAVTDAAGSRSEPRPLQRSGAQAQQSRARRDGDWPGAPADWWGVEPRVGRVATGVPNRVDRLRCLGNAVVPQVAQYIGELVVAAHERGAS